MKMKRRSTNIIINASLVIISIIIGLLVIEGVVRFRQYVRYGTTSPYIGGDRIKDHDTGLMILPPNTKTASIKINSLGFRSPELEDPKPLGRVRIAFIGSSTTFCAEAGEEKRTWPYLVWHDLQKTYPQIKIDYVNAAVVAYGVPNDIVNLEKRIKPLQPDIVIIYEGFNDMCWAANKLAIKQEKSISRESITWEGLLEKYSLAYNIIKKNLGIFINQQKAKSGKDRLSFEPKEVSITFRRELTELVMASKRAAPIVAIATLSYKIRREQSGGEKLRNANTALFYMPYMSLSGLLDAYEEYNRVIREVAKETGVILIKNELIIPGDDRYFKDSIHFTDQGCGLMAKRIVDSLAGSAEFIDFLRTRIKK
jgi:lysophospholipase L1-like esterase